MSGSKEVVTFLSSLLLISMTFGSCSDDKEKMSKKNMNNFEKHFSELYDTNHVTVAFERRKNQTENESRPDSFDCAVVKIIDSPSLSKVLEDDELFDKEYQQIEKFLRDSAKTINPHIFSLALTVVDTIYSEKNDWGLLDKKRTKTKSIVPSLVLENNHNIEH